MRSPEIGRRRVTAAVDDDVAVVAAAAARFPCCVIGRSECTAGGDPPAWFVGSAAGVRRLRERELLRRLRDQSW